MTVPPGSCRSGRAKIFRRYILCTRRKSCYNGSKRNREGDCLMEKLNELANRLTKLGYTARVFSTAQEAKDYLLESIPQSDTVGVGGSMTVRQLGLAEALRGRGAAEVVGCAMARVW